MPAAVLAGGLVAIALAFAAISAALLIRQLVIGPIRGTASAVSEVALVGGVLAWALTQLANIIEIGISGFDYLANVGKQQAADWWNTLVYGTVNALYRDLWNAVIWYWTNWTNMSSLPGRLSAIENTVNHYVTAALGSVSIDLAGLHAWINSYELPLIRGIGDDLAGLHGWINGYQLPLIRGIGDDLAGLHDWINAHLATRDELAQAQARAMAAAQALVVPIEAAIQEIEDSPCQQFCSPLGELGQLLQGLEDAGMLAIMIALVEEAVTNPSGVKDAISNDIMPPIRSAVSALQLGIPD